MSTSHVDAFHTLSLLAASGDRVMVTAVTPEGDCIALFDSPVDAEDAIIGARAALSAAESLGRPFARLSVQRDESALGTTR